MRCDGISPYESCVQLSESAAVRMCKSLPNCIGYVLNKERTAYTLKFRRPNQSPYCTMLSSKIHSTSACSTRLAFQWVRSNCSLQDVCEVPDHERSAHAWSTSKPPLLLTFQTNGQPFVTQHTSSLTPAWVQQVVNLSPMVQNKFVNTKIKMAALRSFLNDEKLSDDQLIVFVDGSDVVYGGCLDFEDRLRTIATNGVVFSAEFGCGDVHVPFPPGCIGIPSPPYHAEINNYASCRSGHVPVPCAHGTRKYRFLNSGAFAGSKADVLSMLNVLNTYDQSCFLNRAREVYSDQTMYNRYFLDFPTRATLDYSAKVFITTFRLNRRALRRVPDNTYYDWRNKSTCFMHNAGRSMWSF